MNLNNTLWSMVSPFFQISVTKFYEWPLQFARFEHLRTKINKFTSDVSSSLRVSGHGHGVSMISRDYD